MPTFKERYRDLQEMVRELHVLRKHNLKFKASDPQDTFLLFSEGLICTVTIERFVRIILGPRSVDANTGNNLTLFPLLQRAVDDEVLTLPHKNQLDGIRVICDFRNGLLHGNFEQVAVHYQTDVLGYFRSHFAGDVESMHRLTDELFRQIDPETGERYALQIVATIDVSTEVIGRLCLELSSTLGASVPFPREAVATLSANAPSWITLVLGHPVSASLLAASTTFVASFAKKTGERAAEDFWANKALIAAKLKETGIALLGMIATHLGDASRASKASLRLAIRSGHTEAVLSLPSGEEEGALVLALLTIHAADLRRLLRDEIGPKSRGPYVHLAIDKSGAFVIRWFDGTDWSERRVPFSLPE